MDPDPWALEEQWVNLPKGVVSVRQAFPLDAGDCDFMTFTFTNLVLVFDTDLLELSVDCFGHASMHVNVAQRDSMPDLLLKPWEPGMQEKPVQTNSSQIQSTCSQQRPAGHLSTCAHLAPKYYHESGHHKAGATLRPPSSDDAAAWCADKGALYSVLSHCSMQ